jgi:hypothetical protein
VAWERLQTAVDVAHRSADRIKVGEFLRDMAESGERHTQEQGVSQPATPTLAALGLDRSESSRFQGMAAVLNDRPQPLPQKGMSSSGSFAAAGFG